MLLIWCLISIDIILSYEIMFYIAGDSFAEYGGESEYLGVLADVGTDLNHP